jgi:hypothetical protein
LSDKPFDPKARTRRPDYRREPATIDLSPTEVRTEPVADAPVQEPASPEPASSEPTSSELTSSDTVSSEAPRSDAIASAAPTGESSAEPPRPTPDEVIPTDDATLSGAAPPERAASLPPHRAAESEPPRSGPGVAALLTAGLIGGLIGAGALALTQSWWRPGDSGARLAQIEQRIAAAPNLAPLESRVSALAADTKALADQLGTTRALAERGAQQAQEALKRPPQAAATENAAGASAVADLASRLAAVEKAAETRTQALAAIEKEVQARAQAASSLKEQVAAADSRVQAAATAAQGLERRVTDQDGRLTALAKQVADNGPDALAATLRVTLADRLQDSLREGAPLGQTLAALRRVGVKPDTLRPLEPYAQSAPPSAAALVQEFEPIGARMIAQARPAGGDWGERVWRMLDKVVTVRAIDDPKATDVASVVGRIEDALDRGAMSDAANAWQALPEASRNIAPDWGAKLRQRASAEESARGIYADALSTLEASTR